MLAFGGAHHDTISAHSHMGSLLVAQGRLDEAEPYVDRALEGMKSGRLAADRASVEFDRARILAARGRKDEAAALARGASTVLKGAGPDWAAKSGEIDGWIAALAGAG